MRLLHDPARSVVHAASPASQFAQSRRSIPRDAGVARGARGSAGGRRNATKIGRHCARPWRGHALSCDRRGSPLPVGCVWRRSAPLRLRAQDCQPPIGAGCALKPLWCQILVALGGTRRRYPGMRSRAGRQNLSSSPKRCRAAWATSLSPRPLRLAMMICPGSGGARA